MSANRYNAKSDAIRKSNVLRVRLTNTQKAKLKQLAEDAEMGVSEYIRVKIEESARCKIIADIETEK